MAKPLVPARSTVDRESFQALLASAFVIQQSQMDRQSRSAIVEVGRLVTSGELDADGAMRRIVAQMQKVVNIDGADIDLTVGAQLSLPGLEGVDPSSGFGTSENTPCMYDAWVDAADISLDPSLNVVAAHLTEASAAATDVIRAEELVHRDSTGMSAPRTHEAPPSAGDKLDALLEVLGVVSPPLTTRYRTPWKPVLVSLAIALFLLLGWMIGRVICLKTARPKGPPLALTAKLDATPTNAEEARQADANPSPPFREKSRRHETSSDSLVVYDHGKVVFRLKSPPAHGQSFAPDLSLVSPRKGNARLFQQVEPVYPEAAKQQRIQGLVILEANVDKGGAVEQLTVVSGDSILATAASDAVLKWRFKPLVQNGQAIPFQTRVKINFVLP